MGYTACWFTKSTSVSVMYLSSLFCTALAVISLAGSTVSAAALSTRDKSGTISFVQYKPELIFEYSTPTPDAQNWIGIYYASYGGPEKEQYVNDAVDWQWAEKSKGKVYMATDKLQPGEYTAYFMAKNGYKWLAEPLDFVVPGNGPLKFLVPQFTTHNGRVGDYFQAMIDGLLANPQNQTTHFVKVSGDDWVQVTSDGTLFGTPKAGGLSKVTIEAHVKNGSKAVLQVNIPVHIVGADLVEQLSVVSLNLWYGGSKVKDFHRKQVQYIANSGADVVALQETLDNSGIRLANALGWYVWQGKTAAIIARYPIVQVYSATGVSGAVRLELDGNKREVIVWNAHLSHKPYGPYDFCFDKMAMDKVMRRENESGRVSQIREIIDKMRYHLNNAHRVPVVLAGDFNAPSHLDWTQETSSKHCNVGAFNWPTSVEPIKAGLRDSFREIYPDPVKVPSNTWSPVQETNAGRPEPRDRIDFIYQKGLRTLHSDSQVWGSHNPEPNQADNEWPSDHAAVRTIFTFQ
ncbi:hypothetical protein PLICBS_006605 [Purpureocillium lilacinum]|uniref:uncharacterized protein n=1 Tax=Purpureocillium lilacinum TaxID=33203 RepID=UPI002080CCAD|nr:hypothetical protein PLICBS_006605 [Purpureocillium lilacinum]